MFIQYVVIQNKLTLSCAGTSLVVQWLRLGLPMQGVQFQSLVRELGSLMPHDQKTRT